MNKIYKLLITSCVMVMGLLSCEDYETESPVLSSFTVYELVPDENGGLVKGSELSNIPVGTTVRAEVITNSDLASFWTGDFSYRPFGTDSVLDSRRYEHYGQLGAEGLVGSTLDGRVGFFVDYAWPETGDYPVTIVLTNHGVAGPDFRQQVFDFTVNVVN